MHNIAIPMRHRRLSLAIMTLAVALAGCPTSPDDNGFPGGSTVVHGDAAEVGVDINWVPDQDDMVDAGDGGLDASDAVDATDAPDSLDADVGDGAETDDSGEGDVGDADSDDFDGSDQSDGSPDADLNDVDPGDPHLTLDHSSLTFNSAGIGITARRTLTLENSGTGVLVITAITIESRSPELRLGEFDLPISLAEEESHTIEVTYTPIDCRADDGDLIISSNDSAGAERRVSLEPTALVGHLQISPNPIAFGRVPAREFKTMSVTLRNTGSCEIDIDDLYLLGSVDFDFTRPTLDGRPTPIEPDLPILVGPDSREVVFLTYFPTSDASDEGTLVALAANASNPNVEVAISGNRSGPCMEVTGEHLLAFGPSMIGEDHSVDVTITNCSDSEDLSVDVIELSAHDELSGWERFTLTDVPSLLVPHVIGPGESTVVEVTYSPILYTPETHPDCEDSSGCTIEDGAFLTIDSDDEIGSPRDLETTGIGTNLTCPTAVARGRVSGTTAWGSELHATVRQTIELDGAGSFDPNGGAVAYEWSVVDSPESSISTFLPSSAAATPTYYLDMVGTYRLRLNVTGETGLRSCEPAEVLVTVRPGHDIYVQVWWETPGDINTDDSGWGARPDLDLHFLHPNGNWKHEVWDCAWYNESPDWGLMHNPNDNPTLIHSDYDLGAETVILDNPEGTGDDPTVYSIGVFDYADHGFGPSHVTVQVFMAGHEVQTFTHRNLKDGEFWYAAQVVWPSHVQEIDFIYPGGFPTDGP